MKKLLFSIPKSEFRVDHFRAGGKGGQKQNKTSSGTRITHLESKAVGESREGRSQTENKRKAFERLASSKTFLTWVRMKAAAISQGYNDLKDKLDTLMKPQNIRTEYITSYTCDTCGRIDEVVTTEGSPTVLPRGWKQISGSDLHKCYQCTDI